MPEAVYVYRSASRRTLYQLVRHVPKRFSLFDGAGRRLSEFPRNTGLYRLPELHAADPTAIVYVVEGEKDADRLGGLGYVATTNPGGCRLGWKPEYSAELTGRRVVILPDADRPGKRHAESVQVALLGVTAAVVILPLPRLRPPQDVSDWLDFRDGSRAELDALTRQALGTGEAPPQPRGGHRKRHLVFASALPPTERLLLLALQHLAEVPTTAGSLARATGLHRVTVQRLLARLTARGLAIREEGTTQVRWDKM